MKFGIISFWKLTFLNNGFETVLFEILNTLHQQQAIEQFLATQSHRPMMNRGFAWNGMLTNQLSFDSTIQ